MTDNRVCDAVKVNRLTQNEVTSLFDRLAPRYNLLTSFFSLGLDGCWRNHMVKQYCREGSDILDLATGTGAVLEAVAKQNQTCKSLTGVDISSEMLEKARRKLAGLSIDVSLITATCEQLPLADQSMDRVIIAFGLRNVQDMPQVCREAFRVLRPGGYFLALETTMPQNPFIQALYKIYFHGVMMPLGTVFSHHRSVYPYFYDTIRRFGSGQSLLKFMTESGFSGIQVEKLFFGVSSLFLGKKPLTPESIFCDSYGRCS